MTVSFEIARRHLAEWPPFTDGCEKCRFDGAVVPHATVTNGDTLMAFYHHGRCGHRWFTSWQARYSHSWERVIGQPVHAEQVETARMLALPPGDAA